MALILLPLGGAVSFYKENLRKNIRQRRIAAGLSQTELAKLCRRTNRFISALETTPRNVTLETLEALAGALKCTVPDLLGSIKEMAGPGKRVKRPVEEIHLTKAAAVGLEAAIRLLNRAKRSLNR